MFVLPSLSKFVHYSQSASPSENKLALVWAGGTSISRNAGVGPNHQRLCLRMLYVLSASMKKIRLCKFRADPALFSGLKAFFKQTFSCQWLCSSAFHQYDRSISNGIYLFVLDNPYILMLKVFLCRLSTLEFSYRVYGALLEDLVSVLLQKDPEDRPSAKQILYVPAMQSYVKKFLLGERERVDSMASDVYDVSGKCPSSCVIDSKEVGRPQRNSSAEVEAPRGKSLEDENRCGENTLKSHEHSRVTNSKLRNIPAQNTTERPCNNICAPSHALNEMEQDSTCKIKATKPRKTIIASENLLKLRARLRSRFSVGTAHAQERRYSEQNLVCAGACGSVCKERILSHCGQLEEITHAEDDVFVKNQVTVIPSRIPNSKYVTQRGDSTPKTLKENRSCLDKRIPEAVTRRRQKPAMSVCQPKCNEGIPIKKRHQSELAAFVERDRCPKQRPQQLQRQVEVNFTGQPRVNDKENVSHNS